MIQGPVMLLWQQFSELTMDPRKSKEINGDYFSLFPWLLLLCILENDSLNPTRRISPLLKFFKIATRQLAKGQIDPPGPAPHIPPTPLLLTESRHQWTAWIFIAISMVAIVLVKNQFSKIGCGRDICPQRQIPDSAAPVWFSTRSTSQRGLFEYLIQPDRTICCDTLQLLSHPLCNAVCCWKVKINSRSKTFP